MAAASAPASYRELTDLHAIQALLAETVAAEALLDAEIEALLDKRTVRFCAACLVAPVALGRGAVRARAARRRWL